MPYNVLIRLFSLCVWFKEMKKKEVGYAKREIDRNEIRGRNLMQQMYLQPWAIMMYRYRTTKRDPVPRSYHIDSFCRDRANIDAIPVYVYYPCYSVSTSITFAFTWDWLRHFDHSEAKAWNIHSAVCSLMEMQGTDSAVYYIGTSKQQFSRGTFGRRIVFDICNQLLISRICQVQKARFKRYKRRLSTDSVYNTSNATVGDGKHFLTMNGVRAKDTINIYKI